METKAPTVVIVGVGALGSHLALFARNLDVRWKVIDFDRVETANILSQFHTRMALGRNKAQSLAQSLHGLFGVKVMPIPHKLTTDNAEQLLTGAALVVDCLDNGEGRRVVQALVRRLKLPCLHGALSADGAFGRVVWDELFAIDDEDVVGQATCEDGDHLPFIASVSAILAQSVQAYLVRGEKISVQCHPGGAVRLG